MTAVEWLVQQICGEHTDFWKEEIQEALEMEKEQIIDAYERGWDMGALDIDCNSEKYYSETYKKDNL
jgi:predicted nucleotidyltransferase